MSENPCDPGVTAANFPEDARAAAAIYLSRGLVPVPMPHRSKDPGRVGWPDLRPTPDELDALFPPGEARNVGVLNGGPSGNMLDVDLDCAEARRAAGRLLPPTGWAFGRPSAKSSHRVYRTDRPLATAQEKYPDLDGTVLLELRGTGGLTVFPPSTHKESAEPIRWHRFGEPGEVAIADLRRAGREVAAVALMARHWPNKGSRQDAYLALVGGLLRSGCDRRRAGRVVAALAAATRDEEPDKRVQVVGATAAKLDGGGRTTGWPRLEKLLGRDGPAVARRAREWLGLDGPPAPVPPGGPTGPAGGVVARPPEPYRRFPVDALPEPLAGYVRECAAALGCDPAYVALPVLAAAASAVGNTRTIRLKGSWEEPCVLWTVVVGDSGTLKSPAFQKALSHLFGLQKGLIREFDVLRAAYNEDLDAYKTAKREGDASARPPERPRLRRVVCADTTIEKLAEILEDNPRGTLVARDELAGWLGSFTRYKGQGGGSDLPNWLELSRSGTLMVDRKSGERKTVFVERAAASVTGTIQPGTLARALTAEHLDAGLAARLLMAMPPKTPKRWNDNEVSEATERAYACTLDRLLALDFDRAGPDAVPHVLGLSDEATGAWVAFYDEWGRRQEAAEGEMAAALSKLEGYACRFTLLHHVVSLAARGEDDRVPVEVASVEAGVALSRWFADEVRRVYRTLSETAEERDARRLFEFITARGGAFTARELQRSNDGKYPTSGHAEAALDALARAGLARWDEPADAPRGGNPARRLVLLTPAAASRPPDAAGDDDPVTDAACGDCGAVVVADDAGLDAAVSAVADARRVGVAVRAAGPDAGKGEILWAALAVDTAGGERVEFRVEPSLVPAARLWEALARVELVMHDAATGLAFLSRAGLRPEGRVRDTMLLAQLLLAGTDEPADLAACRERWLAPGHAGASDAAQVLALADVLDGEVAAAGLAEAARLEERCLPAVARMAGNGVAVDRGRWSALAAAADAERDRLRHELDAAAASRCVNWGSAAQARDALARAGCAVADTADDTLARADHPLAELLRRYRAARKSAGTFGTGWLRHVGGDGRVLPAWRQIGAASGRMSCRGPNMQSLPRGAHRRCVVAPPGRVLIRGDYGQIELRVAAKLSGDAAMLESFRRGDDLHARTARAVLGVGDVSAEQRRLAKALNFGLLYGMGAEGLATYAAARYGVRLSAAEAAEYRRAFFAAYPGLAEWHRRARAAKEAESRTASGRRRLLGPDAPGTRRLNTPVQGTAADGLKTALALLWERRAAAPGAFPVLAVHDEVVVEADAGTAGAAAEWLRSAMADGMAPLLDPVPVEVVVTAGESWGGDATGANAGG